MAKTYANLKQSEKKKGEVEYEAEIPVELLAEREEHVLEDTARDLELPGFRKGKVPPHIVREHIGEMELFESAAEAALRGAIREIMEDENLAIVGTPQLVVTKFAPKNPVTFKVRFALLPEIALPDYKKIGKDIAGKETSIEVSEKEMHDAMERIQKMLAGTVKDGTPPPEFTDEFVAQLGPFKNVEEFRNELRRQLTQEKELSLRGERRDEIVREIVKRTKIEIPQLLIDQEWNAFVDERNEELRRAGLSFEEYMKQTGKDEKTVGKEERRLIEEQVKTNLVFREIRAKENVEPGEKEVETSIAYLKLRYPDQDERSLRATAEAAIVQEKIFDILGVPLKPAPEEAEPESDEK